MKRIYEAIITQHFLNFKQMLFLTGPRQVGKTTISLFAQKLTDNFTHLNWDNQDHRKVILKGPTAVANLMALSISVRKKRKVENIVIS
jgi:predicted AAA+ superfamily ATPase